NPNCATVGPNRATTGVPTPVAMCMMPVSPDTTTRARCSSAPVSCRENSPAALAAAPPATSCCARPRSSGPPTTTARYPVARGRRRGAAVRVELGGDEQRAGQLALAVPRPATPHEQTESGAAQAAVQVEPVRRRQGPQPAGQVAQGLIRLERHDFPEVGVV